MNWKIGLINYQYYNQERQVRKYEKESQKIQQKDLTQQLVSTGDNRKTRDKGNI